MSEYHVFIFIIFGFFLYLILTDPSVAASVDLVSKLGKFQYEKTKWWLIHNPRNPIVKYMMWRKSWKMAEELKKEFEENNFNDQ